MRAVVAASVCGLYAICWWHELYVNAARAYAEASAFALSEACVNATLNQMLGEFGMQCRHANVIISIGPLQRSLYDLLETLHVCGKSRCETLYYDIVQNLSYLVLALVCVTTLALRFLRLERAEQQISLPIANKIKAL
jgi:hypothetical protein